MVWSTDGNHNSGHEAAQVRHLVVPYTRGRVLDIGSGANRLFPHFVTWDNGTDYGNRRVADIPFDRASITMFADKSWDSVFSSHFLEHCPDAKQTLKEWWRILKVGGYLVLYLPHKDLYPNVGTEFANPDHKHDFLPADIIAIMRDAAPAGWTLVENETRDQDNEYSFFMVFQKRNDFIQQERLWQRNPDGKKRCLVVRYGAFGDQIMASSVLPGLKEQGYHVTYQTTERGRDVMQHDPHIDEFSLQSTDQVPNEYLSEYWAKLSKERFDKFVNLCESIEGGLLMLPGRLPFDYPHETRDKLFGSINYLERTHDIAGVPHDFAPAFYPDRREANAANAEKKKIAGNAPLIMWVLNGSALHKTYAWSQMVIMRLLKYTDAHIVTVGDKGGAELEAGYAEFLDGIKVDRSRLHFMATKQSIRETMALAQICDVVVGPETGVLNAVCMDDDVAKVVLLSHSSPDNLTKHWNNTRVICPPMTVKCFPCHQLHYNIDACQITKLSDGKEGAPWPSCAAEINPKDVFEATVDALGLSETVIRKEAV
jgi:ADP-heptose:LPS heptosyltransferase/predicted SAM-dependent methyltransferase